MGENKSGSGVYFIIFITMAAIAVACISSAFYIRHQNDENYKKALKYMEEEDFGAAAFLLDKCGQYKDAEKLEEKAEKGIQYVMGIECINNGRFQKGIDLIQASGYQYDANIIKEAHYLLGKDLYKQEEYQKASLQFIYAKDYKDAAAYDTACSYKSTGTDNSILYAAGKIYYSKHQYKDALACFIAAEGYKNTDKWKKRAGRRYFNHK